MTRKRRNSSTFADLYTDYALTKSELTEILDCSRDSIVRWAKIAFYFIPSFREAYPKKQDGTYDSEAPLNPYQSWVLVRVAQQFSKLKNADRVKMAIKKYPQNFSIYQYNRGQKELEKLSA